MSPSASGPDERELAFELDKDWPPPYREPDDGDPRVSKARTPSPMSPIYGPRGGKWKDPEHTQHWDEPEPGAPTLQNLKRQKQVVIGDTTYKRGKDGRWTRFVDGAKLKDTVPITDRKVLREFNESRKRKKKGMQPGEPTGVRMFHAKKATDPSDAKNPWVQKWGHMDLDRYPPPDMKKKDVQITMNPNDPDSACVMKWRNPTGKWEYAYSQEFHARASHEKFGRAYELAPHFDDAVDLFLSRMEDHHLTTPQRDMACALAIIGITGLRPGQKRNARAGRKTKKGEATYGVSTMSDEHISVEGDRIKISFTGKQDKENTRNFKHPELAEYLKKRIRARKKAPFLFEIPSDKSLIRELHHMGLKDFYPKDFRTIRCTISGLKHLAAEPKPKLPEDDDEAAAKIIMKVINRVSKKVADEIGNSPAQSRRSYIHPEVFASWMRLIGADRLRGRFFKGFVEVRDAERAGRQGTGHPARGLRELGEQAPGPAGEVRAGTHDQRARGVRGV